MQGLCTHMYAAKWCSQRHRSPQSACLCLGTQTCLANLTKWRRSRPCGADAARDPLRVVPALDNLCCGAGHAAGSRTHVGQGCRAASPAIAAPAAIAARSAAGHLSAGAMSLWRCADHLSTSKALQKRRWPHAVHASQARPVCGDSGAHLVSGAQTLGGGKATRAAARAFSSSS